MPENTAPAAFIADYYARNKTLPTRQHIAAHCGVSQGIADVALYRWHRHRKTALWNTMEMIERIASQYAGWGSR